MKGKFAVVIVLLAMLALGGIFFYRSRLRCREVVILSTNDIHAELSNFPCLAEVVAYAGFPIVCANVQAAGGGFPDLPATLP